MALLLGATNGAHAQPRPLPWTGYELALDGSGFVRLGRTARYRGVAYRVRGLAELVPFAGRVRARLYVEDGDSGPWVEVRSGSDGRFEVEVPVPTGIEDGSFVRVEVGPQDEARQFDLFVRPRPGVSLVLRTDRNLYEPGEPVHVWAWLVDEVSRRPIPDQPIELTLRGDSMPAGQHEVRTGPSGVAHLELRVPEGASEGRETILASVPGQLQGTAHFNIGTRTYERVIATVEVEGEPIAPGADATVIVTATAASGAPIVGARVEARIGSSTWGITDADGVARITVQAPAYLVHETGVVPIQVTVHHAGHGSLRRSAQMRLAIPRSLSIEVVPRHGGLVPELDDLLYVRLFDALGDPPAQPTQVTVSGPAVRGGRARVTTDVNGMAEVPARLPIGAASRRSGRLQASVLVEVAGPLERLARVAIPVFRDAEVLPTPSRPISTPGSRLTVRVDRRPSVARREVVLELLDARRDVLRVVWLSPGQSSAEIDLPPDRIGLMTLRARAVHADETLEGVGGTAPLIVRPAHPDFVQVAPVRRRWTVGETARVTLSAGASTSGGPRRWAAVLVRDLAAHDGESPFSHRFLDRAFRQALLEASDAVSRRLVYAALGAHATRDANPNPAPPLVDALGLARSASTQPPRQLRDPWPQARDLERRGGAPAMRALERRLELALRSGGLDAVTTTTSGRGRALRRDLLSASRRTTTLGGAVMTPQMLEASDPSFSYDNVARRVARARLVRLMVALATYLDPGDHASPAARVAAREPFQRWLPRMVERGLIRPTDLDDPWGNRFELRSTRRPVLLLSAHATQVELVSPGPDGRLGTRDDVRDPFARAVPPQTPYALASREDALMRQFAVLSPARRTLDAIRESYERVSVEMSEDAIGDAVAAQVSEGTIGLGNLSTIGHGGGGGSGSGYGRGAGGFRGRRARAPSFRPGPTFASGLATVVRERFPPTLLFVPALELDASGTAEIPIELTDAITTYLVEVVVWREDGWSWSDETRIEVDREIVIAAPVPAMAHVGDRISLPIRVVNHGDTPRELDVQLIGSERLGIGAVPAQRVSVGAGDAVAVHFDLAPSRAAEGTVQFAVVSPEGVALDAVRLPMRVVDVSRQATQRSQTIAAGSATLNFTVPAGADPREGEVRLAVGTSLFEAEVPGPWLAWAPGRSLRSPEIHRHIAAAQGSPIELAFAIGAAWSTDALTDAEIDLQLDRLTALLDSQPSTSRDDRWQVAAETDQERVFLSSWALLGLRQVVESPGRRQLPRARQLVERLRAEVGSGALAASDPGTWALGAAALGWTSSADDLDRTRELVRRLSRHTVTIGDDRWLALETHAVRGTVLWALAEVALGHRESTFSILATVNRWVEAGHRIGADVRGLARAATRRMMRGPPPEQVTVTIDGVERTVPLVDGAARIDHRELASPGPHTVVVSAGAGAPVYVTTRARYGVPWSAAAPGIASNRGPLVLSIEGTVGDLVRRAGLVLVARNRAPRTLRHPIVEIELPTGTELPENALRALRVRMERLDDLLTLHLPPMRPGNVQRIPLRFRWSVAGDLLGLGISGRAEDRPEAVTVIPPRTVSIQEVAQ